jgi:FimV-like protein
MYRIDCARAYIEEDENDKARNHLTTIGTLPTLDEDDAQFRKEALELLEKIKNK